LGIAYIIKTTHSKANAQKKKRNKENKMQTVPRKIAFAPWRKHSTHIRSITYQQCNKQISKLQTQIQTKRTTKKRSQLHKLATKQAKTKQNLK